MPTIEQKKGLTSKDIHLIIGFFLCFLFGRIVPAFGPLTDLGVRMLGVVIGLIYMTCVGVPIMTASLLGILSFVVNGYYTASTLLTTWLGSTTTFTLVFAGALSLALRESGAMTVLAKKMLGIKFVQGRPLLLMSMILIVAYMVSIFMGGAPYYFLFFGVIDSIVDVAGYDREDKFVRMALMGVYVGGYGGFLIPFRGAMLITVSMFNQVLAPYGLEFDGALYMLIELATFVFFDILYALSLKFIFKVDLSKIAHVDVTKVKGFAEVPDHFDKKQKICLWSVLFCIAYTLFVTFASKELPGYSIWGSFTSTLIWAVPLLLFAIIRMDGKPIMDLPRLSQGASMWPMICLVGSMTMLGKICTDTEIGIRTLIASVFNPIFQDMSIPMVLLVVVLFSTIVTQVVNGQVLTMGITPIIGPLICERIIAGEVGNPTVALTVLSSTAQVAFMFISGSVNAAYIKNRPEITQKFLFREGSVILIIYMVWQFIVGVIFNYLFPVTIAL